MNLLEERLSLLIESMSSTVFHATDEHSLYGIVFTNTFKLSTIKDDKLDHNPVNEEKYKYFMSTARTVNSLYTKGFINAGSGAIIELDGAKLSHNYKGKAVDWFAGTERQKQFGNIKYDEAEDRLYSKAPAVPHAQKYIKAVHILAPFGTDKLSHYIDKTIEFEGRKFPIYLYDKKKDMLFVRRERARKV